MIWQVFRTFNNPSNRLRTQNFIRSPVLPAARVPVGIFVQHLHNRSCRKRGNGQARRSGRR